MNSKTNINSKTYLESINSPQNNLKDNQKIKTLQSNYPNNINFDLNLKNKNRSNSTKNLSLDQNKFVNISKEYLNTHEDLKLP